MCMCFCKIKDKIQIRKVHKMFDVKIPGCSD